MSQSVPEIASLNSYIGVSQRPPVDKALAVELAAKLFGFQVSSHQETKELESYDDRNFLLKGKLNTNEEDNLFVLKVFSSDTSKFQDSLRVNADIVSFVNSATIECPVPQTSIFGTKHVLCRFNVPPMESPRNTVEKTDNSLAIDESNNLFEVVLDEEKSPIVYAVQLFSYIHGVMLSDVQWTQQLLMDFGSKIAQLQVALKQYSQANTWITNSSIKPSNWLWFNINTPQTIQRHAHAVWDPARQSLVKQIAQQYQTKVLDKLDIKEFQLVHSDLNCQNAIVRENDKGEMKVMGVIDFGDKEISHPLIDLGVAIGYTAIDGNKKKCDIIQVTREVMAGYQSVIPLTESEMDIVLHAALGRIALSVVNGTYQYSFMPDNEYLLLSSKDGWEVLEKLKHIPKTDVVKSWKFV